MIAVVPVRDGALPAGGAEVVAECEGRVVVAGSDTAAAIAELARTTEITHARCWETTSFGPGAWAHVLARIVATEAVIVLPASPDGRDLAPRLARALGRPLLAGCVDVTGRGASVSRWGGLVLEDIDVGQPFVATLLPGVRGVEPPSAQGPSTSRPTTIAIEHDLPPTHEAITLRVLPPDAATIDLAEAPRIVGGGAGLDHQDRLVTLIEIARALGASLGATRVVTDRGWVHHDRQIGTTGVVVDPRLYVAFGISGAVQHTSALGRPDHIISVNTDPHCPMMQLADLAIVADANAVVDELARRLGADRTGTT